MENPPLKSAYTVDTQFSHKIKQNQGVEHGIYAPGKVTTQTFNASPMCRIIAVSLTALVPRFMSWDVVLWQALENPTLTFSQTAFKQGVSASFVYSMNLATVACLSYTNCTRGLLTSPINLIMRTNVDQNNVVVLDNKFQRNAIAHID